MSARTVVITGANRGLGLELVKAHLDAGDHVIAGCRTPLSANTLNETEARVLPLDVADSASIRDFAVAIGSAPVHVLYNSAGVDTRAFGADETGRGILTVGLDQFEQVMRVNVTAPVAMVQALADQLRASKGKVVNVSSQIGSIEVAQKMGRDGAYAASKAALNMVTLKQAQALAGDGVTVIALHPGWLRTEMGGSAADLEPHEAARQIATTVTSLRFDQSGSFLRWDGSTHPW